jgi:hypothetical protein
MLNVLRPYDDYWYILVLFSMEIRNLYLQPLRKESAIENMNIFIFSINCLLFYVVEIPIVYFINLNI